MPTIYINQFDGGIVNDPRNPSGNVCRASTNFDIFTNTRKLTPYRSSEDGDSASSSSQKQNFAVALQTGTIYNLYALGVVTGTGRAEVLYKDLGADLGDDVWSIPHVNNQSPSGATNFELFVYYKTTGYIYGAKANTHIWRFDPAGGAWADTHQALSYTNIAQGLVHSKDDRLYIPYDNKIAKNDNGTWTTVALTLPSEFYITSICEHGDFIAIACAPLNGIGNSRVFLWDRDTSITTVSESISWGTGILKVLHQIDGLLLGIELIGTSSTTFTNQLVFRYFNGIGAIEFNRFSGANTLSIAKQRVNNRLYFLSSVTLNGTVRDGLWSVGRNMSGDPLSVVHERTSNNDTALGNGVLKGFYIIGDYAFISYVNNSSVYALSKTDDQANYTATSIRETTINQGMPYGDRPKKKQLMAVALTYEKLPTAGQAVLKYRVDGATSYTTVFTETTNDAVSTEMTNAGGTEFTAGRDYEFRIESTGGAEVTGLIYKYENLETSIS